MKVIKKEVKKEGIKEDIKKAINIENEILPFRIDRPFRLPPKTLGQKASDLLTKWAGSWVFIILIGVFLFIWMVVNTTPLGLYLEENGILIHLFF
jgi:uncharacterized membrane protein